MEETALLCHQMYDLGNEGYKIIDKDFNIISCNKKYLEFNNLEDQKDLVGQKCDEFLCSTNCGSELCSLILVLNGKETGETVLKKTININETKYFILNIKPYKNEKDEIIGIIECFIDITTIKKAELAIKESEAQLKNINATKEKLFSIIAHDLRSPFTSIIGFSEILIENIRDLDIAETEEFLNNINSSAQNTLSLLDNLLNWVKTQTRKIIIQPKKLLLSSVIQETIDLSNAPANIKNITINHIHSDSIEVYSDENMVKTVLRNLISNAIKFTKSKGRIDVSAISKQDQVEITISDNGVGMNENTLKNLFDISATTETTYGTADEKGSGLGLILCKEFIEKLGGSIWVESEIEKGSVFKFTLPLNRSYIKEV